MQFRTSDRLWCQHWAEIGTKGFRTSEETRQESAFLSQTLYTFHEIFMNTEFLSLFQNRCCFRHSWSQYFKWWNIVDLKIITLCRWKTFLSFYCWCSFVVPLNHAAHVNNSIPLFIPNKLLLLLIVMWCGPWLLCQNLHLLQQDY